MLFPFTAEESSISNPEPQEVYQAGAKAHGNVLHGYNERTGSK